MATTEMRLSIDTLGCLRLLYGVDFSFWWLDAAVVFIPWPAPFFGSKNSCINLTRDATTVPLRRKLETEKPSGHTEDGFPSPGFVIPKTVPKVSIIKIKIISICYKIIWVLYDIPGPTLTPQSYDLIYILGRHALPSGVKKINMLPSNDTLPVIHSAFAA